MKLSERLDLDTVEALQGKGAGPKTVAALKALATESASLPEASRRPPSPSMCPRRRPRRKIKPSCSTRCGITRSIIRTCCPISFAWSKPAAMSTPPAGSLGGYADVITARLSYFNQKEDYKLVSLNDKVVTDAAILRWAAPCPWATSAPPCATSSTPQQHTSFAWERWTTLRAPHARLFLTASRLSSRNTPSSIGARKERRSTRITAGYHGEIFVDNEFHTIVRIQQEAENIPVSFPVREAQETLDYDFTKIGDQEFFLPLVVDVRMHAGREWTKNTKEFRLYRKFSADAVIKFDGTELPPLPDDKTKEQPPQQPPK